MIAIRPIMNLTLTYDHRLVDGALAGRFLRDLREKLQTWGEDRLLRTVGQRIVPFIGYEDAAGAIEWLERAFGFREERDQRHEEGRDDHARGAPARRRHDLLASPDGYASPRTVARRVRGGAAGLRQSVGDRRALRRGRRRRGALRAARSGGATIIREPEEPGIGFRIYAAEDPEGHRWMFGQRV